MRQELQSGKSFSGVQPSLIFSDWREIYLGEKQEEPPTERCRQQGSAGMTSAGGEWETFNGAEDGASLVR